ncbi:hypothetical protein [Kribbella deserti]|uniref:Uncharacterized protein n=1 Tax=Kribbella deserti TaxID=1926257 RepID=A0ABV6QGL9_9ACTN
MDEPIQAVRSAPGEYFLAAEEVHAGQTFKFRDAVYEIVTEPTKFGIAWSATVKVVEGLRPGSTFRAMLHTGRRVN